MIRNLASVTALLALLVASFIAIGGQGVPWYTSADDWRQLTLLVPDANGLVPKSRVLLRGVPIGEILTIAPDAKNVAVQMQYNKAIQLPADSTFRIENLSALGEAYLLIKPTRDGGRMLANNERVQADPQTVQGTIGGAAVAITGLVSALDVNRVNAIVNELNTALSDAAVATTLADGSRKINALVSARLGDIRRILSDAQTLLDNTNARASQFPSFGKTMRLFSGNLRPLLEQAVVLIFNPRMHFPDDLKLGTLQILGRLNRFEDDIGPHAYNLTEPLLPAMQATAAALTTIDTSRLLDSAIDAVGVPGAPGTFTVHVIPSR